MLQTTYDIYFEIDGSCEELIEAYELDLGVKNTYKLEFVKGTYELEFVKRAKDDMPFTVIVRVNEKAFIDIFEFLPLAEINEFDIAECLLPDVLLAECTKKVTIKKPYGSVIEFY